MSVVNNVQFGADISDLEAAAKQAIGLLTAQQGAINNLMVTQFQHNQAQNKYNATVKATLDNGRKVVQQLSLENGQWTITKTRITEATQAMSKLNDEKKKQRDLDKFTGNLQDRADRVRRDREPPEVRDGPSPFLSGAALSRIAEATAFKSFLNFGTDQFKDAIKQAREYQIQISLIRTVSQEAQLGFGQWSKSIKEVSDALGTDLVDTAKAAYDVIQSQVVTGPQTIDFLRASGQLARTTGTDIKTASDLLASVVQGFDQSVTQVDHTAAVLFKTVELGRIQMNELTTTMGRVAPSANVLGIRLEEVSAALSTLTRQGVKTSDATTLVTNVILKLAKPTEAMKALMKSWGFETSEAAIKTLSFAGVLRKLAEATDGGKLGELAELFNELRGLRGAVGLTSAFKDFEKDLAKIDNAEETFRKAQEIRAESSADKLTKFATQVKNVFTEEYGQAGLAFLEGIVGPMGKGEDAARTLAAAFAVTAGVAVGGKIAMAAYGQVMTLWSASALRINAQTLGNAAAQEAYNLALAKGATAAQATVASENARTIAMQNATLSQAQQRAAMLNSIATMGLLAAAVTAATLVWQAYNDKLAPAAYATESNLARIGEAIKNVSAEKVLNVSVERIKTFEKLVKVTFEAPLRAAAEGVSKANAEVVKLEETSARVAEDFSIAYKGYLDGLRGDVKDLNTDITKALQNIQKSKKESMGFKDTLEEIVRNTQMKYATDNQKMILTENNITRLKNDADALFKKGDEESVASARKKYAEIARLITENFDREQDMRKQQMEQYAKQNPNAGPQLLTVSTIPLQKRLNALLDEQNSKEAMYVATQEKSVKIKKEEVAAITENARRTEVAAKKLIEFSAFDKAGKVKDEYTTGGKFDESKVRAALQGLQDELVGLVGSPEKSEAALKFYENMYARIDSIARVANAKTNEGLLAQDQQRLLKTQDMFLKQNKEAQDKIGKASASAFGKGQALDIFNQDASSLKDLLEAGPGWANKWLNLSGMAGNVTRGIASDKAKEEALAEFAKFEAASKRIKENAMVVEGQLIPNPGSVEAATKQFEKFKEKVVEYIKILTKADVTDPSQLGGILVPGRDGKDPVRFGDIMNDLNGQKKALLDSAKVASEQELLVQDLIQQVLKFQKDTSVPLLMQFPQFGAEAKAATEEAKSGIDLLKQSIIEADEAARHLRDTLKSMPKGAEGMAGEVDADMGDASYFAFGGITGFPGKPRGTDRIPVWMAPGEFIVNAKDSRRFYSQLVDINRGKTPKYYSGGGMVSNTIGDIHVTVNGADAKSPARIGRAVGIEIRREMKRGNLR